MRPRLSERGSGSPHPFDRTLTSQSWAGAVLRRPAILRTGPKRIKGESWPQSGFRQRVVRLSRLRRHGPFKANLPGFCRHSARSEPPSQTFVRIAWRGMMADALEEATSYQFTCPTRSLSIMAIACVRAFASVGSAVSERCTSLPCLRMAQ